MADEIKRRPSRAMRRPTVRELEQIQTATMMGMSLKCLADELLIDIKILQKWAEKYKTVQDALQVGRAKRRRRAYACFFEQAFPLDEHGRPTRKGDSSLMIFWMKTRERWKEARDEAHSGSEEPPIIVFKAKEPKKTD